MFDGMAYSLSANAGYMQLDRVHRSLEGVIVNSASCLADFSRIGPVTWLGLHGGGMQTCQCSNAGGRRHRNRRQCNQGSVGIVRNAARMHADFS